MKTKYVPRVNQVKFFLEISIYLINSFHFFRLTLFSWIKKFLKLFGHSLYRRKFKHLRLVSLIFYNYELVKVSSVLAWHY